MTPAEFKALRERLGMTQRAFGAALGRTERWVQLMEHGPAIEPMVELACEALEKRRAAASGGKCSGQGG